MWHPTPLQTGREDYRFQWDLFKDHIWKTANANPDDNVTLTKPQLHGPNQTTKKIIRIFIGALKEKAMR